MRRDMPADIREGWRILMRGLANLTMEAQAERAAQWIALRGRRVGARAPSVAERAAALGVS
eukprot:7605399-Alexandrium_andersonii.AAC.1